MPRDNFTMSENSGSFGMQQRQDRFDAIGDLIVGPPGPPGPQGPPGADGTVSFDELTPAQKESLRGEGVPAGGTTGQVLAKASNTDYDTEWVDQSGGGGGTSDYTDLSNKPSINGVTLSGNKTAAQLGLATPSDIPTVPVQSVNNKTGAVELSASDVSALPLAGGTMSGAIDMGRNKITNVPTPTYYLDAANKNYVDARYIKPSTGIPQSDLASAVQNKLDKTVVIADTQPTATENKLWVDTDAGAGSSYQVPTVAEMEAADAQTAAEIGIVITGKRPSMAVTAGQYVIVRDSTISGITDGLYTANAALSPSTDVTAANLIAVSNGGLNSLKLDVDGKIGVVSETPIVSGDDLNNYTQSGYYRTGGTLPANAPSGTTWAIFQVLTIGTTRIQFIYKSDYMYMRTGNSTTWYNWYRYTGTQV